MDAKRRLNFDQRINEGNDNSRNINNNMKNTNNNNNNNNFIKNSNESDIKITHKINLKENNNIIGASHVCHDDSKQKRFGHISSFNAFNDRSVNSTGRTNNSEDNCRNNMNGFYNNNINNNNNNSYSSFGYQQTNAHKNNNTKVDNAIENVNPIIVNCSPERAGEKYVDAVTSFNCTPTSKKLSPMKQMHERFTDRPTTNLSATSRSLPRNMHPKLNDGGQYIKVESGQRQFFEDHHRTSPRQKHQQENIKSSLFHNNISQKQILGNQQQSTGYQQHRPQTTNSIICFGCKKPVEDQILQAVKQTYHPRCFKCCECGLCLDGLDFAVNEEDSYKIYCHKDYFKIFSPRCAVCNGTIDPIQGTNEVVRVVSADADYHIDCYKCQRCQMQLTDEPDKMCYPLGKMLFCYKCRLLQGQINNHEAELDLRDDPARTGPNYRRYNHHNLSQPNTINNGKDNNRIRNYQPVNNDDPSIFTKLQHNNNVNIDDDRLYKINKSINPAMHNNHQYYFEDQQKRNSPKVNTVQSPLPTTPNHTGLYINNINMKHLNIDNMNMKKLNINNINERKNAVNRTVYNEFVDGERRDRYTHLDENNNIISGGPGQNANETQNKSPNRDINNNIFDNINSTRNAFSTPPTKHLNNIININDSNNGVNNVDNVNSNKSKTENVANNYKNKGSTDVNNNNHYNNNYNNIHDNIPRVYLSRGRNYTTAQSRVFDSRIEAPSTNSLKFTPSRYPMMKMNNNINKYNNNDFNNNINNNFNNSNNININTNKFCINNNITNNINSNNNTNNNINNINNNNNSNYYSTLNPINATNNINKRNSPVKFSTMTAYDGTRSPMNRRNEIHHKLSYTDSNHTFANINQNLYNNSSGNDHKNNINNNIPDISNDISKRFLEQVAHI